MNGVNLVPAPRREARRVRILTRRWAAGSVAYGAIVLAGLGSAAAVLETDHAAAEKELRRLNAQIKSGEGTEKDLARDQAELQRAVDASKAVSEQPDWSVLLAKVAEWLGEDAALRRLVLKQDPLVIPTEEPKGEKDGKGAAKPPPRGYTLTLEGVTASQAAPSDIVLNLERTRIFDRVKLVQTKREATGKGEVVIFEIECRLAGGGG